MIHDFIATANHLVFFIAPVKIDYRTGRTTTAPIGANQFPSEAVFVPAADGTREDAGYLISLAYDATLDRSFAAIFDARDIEQGTIARAWFDHHIPRPLHGAWDAGASTGPHHRES